MTEEQREKVRRLRSEGMTLVEVARAVGCSLKSASRVHVGPTRDEKGIKAWYPGCRRLSYEDREQIAYGLARGESLHAIAQRLARSTSTISREVKAGGGRRIYRAFSAHNRAYRMARRPKVAKLDHGGPLAEVVTSWLEAWWSPEEIANRLPVEFPHDPMMRVPHETIYHSIYVQGRGELRRELARSLRSGRTQRKRRGTGTPGGPMRDMVLISERPAEVEDRAVPGHWEGDLVIGKGGHSQVGTLVERTSGYLALVHLRDCREAPAVAKASAKTVRRLPAELVRSITWDQGREMAHHARFSVVSGAPVYFCDPHSPWQRGTNENTNGLLRQYLPKGMDLLTWDEYRMVSGHHGRLEPLAPVVPAVPHECLVRQRLGPAGRTGGVTFSARRMGGELDPGGHVRPQFGQDVAVPVGAPHLHPGLDRQPRLSCQPAVHQVRPSLLRHADRVDRLGLRTGAAGALQPGRCTAGTRLSRERALSSRHGVLIRGRGASERYPRSVKTSASLSR